MKYEYTIDELYTMSMLEKPITDLSRTIGANWFGSLEKLSEKSGVNLQTILRAVHGGKVGIGFERRIRRALE